MKQRYSYPSRAMLNQFLPKSKIFESAKPTSKIKELFTKQINKITIAYSLSSRSINLPATATVDEILIFSVDLKDDELNSNVLKCIDMAIRSPVLFELHYNNKQKTMAAFKRPSEADSSKWVISEYFESDWIAEDEQRAPLPVALDLGGLYEILLKPLMPYEARPDENVQAHVKRMDLVHAKQRELDKIEVKLLKEKQFNRKVGIHAELRKVKSELEELKQLKPR